MFSLELEIAAKTERRLRKILDLCKDQEIFVQNFIDFQISELKKAIFNIQSDLRQFEQKYKLTSDEFYRRFDKGKTDDREDYMVWAGIYELMLKNERDLKALE